MSKNIQRLVSMMLLIIMIMSMIPVSAEAAVGNRNPNPVIARGDFMAAIFATLYRYIRMTINPGMEQGWVLNGQGEYMYYRDGIALTGWQGIGSENDKKTYYFDEDGIMSSDGWMEILNKWYYFQADGVLAKNTIIGDYKVDEDGIRTRIIKEPNRSDGDDDSDDDSDDDRDLKDVVTDKDENVEVLQTNEDFQLLDDHLNQDDNLRSEDLEFNYLLYGYDVLSYGYIDSKNINKTNPIFEATKVKEVDPKEKDPAKRGHYQRVNNSATDIKYLFSQSARSLYQDFDVSASAGYKGLFFSGSVKAEYGLNMSLNEEQMLIKYIQDHKVAEQAYTVPVRTLVGLLSENFKEDVKTYAYKTISTNDEADVTTATSIEYIENESYNPGKLFELYGTHAIAQYNLGGRAELNSVYNNKTQASEEDIRASVEGAYKGFSGKATAAEKTKLEEDRKSSSFKFSSIGGKNISGTNPDDVAKKYDEWVESIKDAPVLSGVANFSQSLIPIWELIEDKEAAKNVKEAFDEKAQQSQTDLSKFDSVPLYITDIVVYSAERSADALKQIPTGYTMVRLNPGTNDETVLEANKGAGGNYIYIAYRASTDRNKAITNIQVVTGDKSVTGDARYTKIPVDLSENAGGKYVYLCYKRITNEEKKDPETKYLKEIRGIYTRSYSVPAGWEWAYKSEHKDLNEGSKKSSPEYIRLLVRRNK